MDELIKINTNEEGKRTVNGRDLYEFLEVKKDYSDWIKAQVKRARLREGIDFIKFPQKGEKNIRPKIEYHFTIEAGKHIGMISGTDKGFEVRDYFIECERQLLEQKPAIPSYPEALRQLADSLEREETNRPKIEYHDEVLKSVTDITVTVIAKDLGTTAIKLNKLLQNIGVQYKSGKTWVLKSEYQDKGYTDTKTHKYIDHNDEVQTAIHTYWTEKGREFIINKWKEYDV